MSYTCPPTYKLLTSNYVFLKISQFLSETFSISFKDIHRNRLK